MLYLHTQDPTNAIGQFCHHLAQDQELQVGCLVLQGPFQLQLLIFSHSELWPVHISQLLFHQVLQEALDT